MYACGLILLDMLTGRRVFEGLTLGETLMNHMNKETPIPPSLEDTPLAEVLRRSTANAIKYRYQDASELLAALNHIYRQVPADEILSEAELLALLGPLPDDFAPMPIVDSEELLAIDVDDNNHLFDALEEELGAPPPSETGVGYSVAYLPESHPLPSKEAPSLRTKHTLGDYPLVAPKHNIAVWALDNPIGGSRWAARGILLYAHPGPKNLGGR